MLASIARSSSSSRRTRRPDLGVVEDVVAAPVVRAARAAPAGAVYRRACRGPPLGVAAGRAALQIEAPQRVETRRSVRSKCSGVTAILPARHGREIGARLVVEAGVGAVDPVAAAARLLGVQLQLVPVDPLAEARDLDAVGRRPGR